MGTTVINPKYPAKRHRYFCLECWNEVAKGKFYCSVGCEDQHVNHCMEAVPDETSTLVG